MGFSDRFFRALLKLFPREFRGDFGEQMTDDFRDQREDAAMRGGVTSVARLWTRAFTDALRRAPREHLDVLRRDAGFALRLFRRRPGMTASALITLAAGIGLNAAVFSVVNGVLWRSLALPDSERLVYLEEVSPAPESELTGASPANLVDWGQQTNTLDALASVRPASSVIVADDAAVELVGASVSRGFFKAVPARTALGRLLIDADYTSLDREIAQRERKRPAAAPEPPVMVLSYDAWQRQFGGRGDIVGRTIDLGRGGKIEIVGVLEKTFSFPSFRNAQFWTPDVPEPWQRRARYLGAVGRLAHGMTTERAQAEFDVIAGALAAAYPDNKGYGVKVTSLREKVTAAVRTQLWFLLLTAGCVLLIACANVANLLLTHTSGRQRELATRVALGANRGHLVRQALTEGLVLALSGGLLGVTLAVWAVPALVARAPRTIPRLNEVSVNTEVFAFAAALSICVGLVCGFAASIAAGRSALSAPLRGTGTSGASQGRRFRHGLIVAEIALALMLSIAASLLVQTMRVVSALPLGYDPANVISIGMSSYASKMRDAGEKGRFEADLIAAIRSVPGVTAAGVGSRPLSVGGMGTAIARPEAPSTLIRISVDAVGPGYLEALGAPLLNGRFFTDRDTNTAPYVAVVNASAERQYWPEGAVGRTILNGKRPLLIVGVIGDIRTVGLEEEPAPTVYLPSHQTATFWSNNMLVRTSGDPRALLPAIRTVTRQVDRRLPLIRIETLQERYDIETAPRRFTLWLVGLFAVLALGLAVVGIYGVVAESVAQRIPEIGVRMALGASRGAVMRMVVTQGAWMVAIGVSLGAAAALAMNGVMASFVFRVPTKDPKSYVVACVCLAAATISACLVPARRASRIDPVTALRD